MVALRFEIYLVNLNPTKGSEINKSRPCVVVSPNDLNEHLNTVIIAPMTTVVRQYPSRIKCKFRGKTGEIALDQIRTVSKIRLIQKLGFLNEDVQNKVLVALQEIFSL